MKGAVIPRASRASWRDLGGRTFSCPQILWVAEAPRRMTRGTLISRLNHFSMQHQRLAGSSSAFSAHPPTPCPTVHVETAYKDVETFGSDIETSATEIESSEKSSTALDSSPMPARLYAETTERATDKFSKRDERFADKAENNLIEADKFG